MANTDDGSCIPIISGCTNELACNYNSANTEDNTSCVLLQQWLSNGSGETMMDLVLF